MGHGVHRLLNLNTLLAAHYQDTVQYLLTMSESSRTVAGDLS